MVAVGIAARRGGNVAQDLDLVEGLVHEVLVVFDHLEAHVQPRGGVQRSEGGGKRGGAHVVVHEEAPRQQAAHGQRNVFAVLEARAAGFVNHPQRERLEERGGRSGGGRVRARRAVL